MDNCKSKYVSAGERTVGDYDPNTNDPLIQKFMNDFATKDANFERDNGKIFLYSAIGIFTLILVFIVLLTCLIYACLRCKRRCNPYKWHCEKKCQKCCRWLFSILMLLLFPLILYLLAEAIDWTRKCREMETPNSPGESKLRRIEKALITDYNNFYFSSLRSADDVVWSSLENVHYDHGPDLDRECGTPLSRQKISDTISNMQIDIDSLCVEIIMWNDFARALIRNVTTFLVQTKEGRAFYKKSGFVKSDYLWLEMSKLFQMNELLRIVGNIVNGIDELYSISSILVHSNGTAKQLLTPYLDNVKEDLVGRGETLRSLFSSISDDIYGDDAKPRSGDSGENIYKELPLWILIFEWLCFVWIILTILILLIALILRCCGKRWRGERRRGRKRKCCSQECGSCLFQFTVYMMSLLFLLALAPVWWNYEYGVGIYNDRCRKENSKKDRFTRSINSQGDEATPAQFSSATADEMFESLSKKVDNFTGSFTTVDRNRPVLVDADENAGAELANICLNAEVEAFLASNATKVDNKIKPPDANELTKSLQNKLSQMAPIIKKLKQNAKLADETPLKKVCNNFKTELNLQDFIKFYNETYSFVSNEMRDPDRVKELSFCNLNNLKENLIDPFDNHEIPKLTNHIAEQCKQIDQHFNDGIGKVTARCLIEVEKIEKAPKENLTQALSDTTNDLDEMFSNGLTNYRSSASEDLGRASSDSTDQNAKCMHYTQCKNGIWIPLLLILLLFWPLIPIAIYLSRLYSCCEARSAVGQDCCYEARLYNAIKDRLYRKKGEFENQARQYVVPCPCPPNALQKQTQVQKQCPPIPQCERKLQLETELAALNRPEISDQPQFSKQNDSQQQSCSKNTKLKYKIRISFSSKPKS